MIAHLRRAGPRTRRARLAGLLALTVVAAGLSQAALPGGSTATAATVLGKLSIAPAKGTAVDPITLTTVSSGTAKGCPSGATNVIGTVTGPGGWATGVLGVGNTASDVSNTADFPAQLSNSFTVLAQNNNLTVLPGKYTITLSCIDELGTTRFGDFIGDLWFTSPSAFQTTDPALPPVTTPTVNPTVTPSPSTGPSATPTITPTPPVGSAATTTTLAATPPATTAEDMAVQLTATITPAAAPGTVTFTDGSGATVATLGTVASTGGTALFSTRLPVGNHSLKATFTPTAGAAYLASSSAAVVYTVTAAAGPPVVGSLVAAPPTGRDVDPITFATSSTTSRTSKGCPTPATNIVGYVTGPGGWAAGILIVANTASDVSNTQDFVVQASNSFTILAQNNALSVLPGRYDVSVYCTDELGATRYGRFTTSLWFTDATNYQSTDPASSQVQTETAMAVTPADRAELGAKVTLNAAVNPANAAGSVQFRTQQNGAYANVGEKITVGAGTATFSTTTLSFGLYQLSAVFTPADGKKFTESTSPEVVFVMAKPIPPRPLSKFATISGEARVGARLSCSATFTGAKSIAYRWFRGDSESIVRQRSYRLTKTDAGRSIRCRVLATNAGGTTYRTSKPMKVAR